MKPGINLILGTMTFGEQVFGTDVRDMIQYFMSFGYTEIDTAYVYNNGESERLLGAGIEKLNAKSVKIATKVNPRITGRLDKDAVLTQFAESLQRMKVIMQIRCICIFPTRPRLWNPRWRGVPDCMTSINSNGLA